MTDGTKVFLIILAGGAVMGIVWGLYQWLIGEPSGEDPTHSPDHDSSDNYE